MKNNPEVSRKLRRIRNILLAILMIGIPLGTPTPKTQSAEDPPLTPNVLPLGASTFFGGAGDQRGSGITISGSNIYVSGSSDVNDGDGLVANYALPLITNASPVWSKTWPTAANYDDFAGVGVSSEGVYLAGQSYSRTTDPAGDKENKGITVKFPLTGPPGGGFDSATWDVQTPAAPGAFPYGGGENLNAATVVDEAGFPFAYVTGRSQSGGANGGRLYVSKLNSSGTILWTQTDAAGSPFSRGWAITTLNGNIYVAGHNDDSGNQVYLVKYAPAGGPATWTQNPSTFNGNYYGITAFGGAIYAFGQRTGGVGGSSDFLIDKWDEAGVRQWTKEYDRGSGEDILYAGVGLGSRIYAVGSTVVGGAGGKDIALLELDPATGDLTGTTLYGGAQDDIANGAATDGTSIYVVGESRSFASGAGNVVGQNDLVLLSFGAGPTAADASISGQVTTPDGAALGGVLVTLTGAKSAWTLTDSKGNYRFDNVDTDNFYSVTPGLQNYSFSPANRSFSLLGNKPDAGFTAVASTAPVGNAIDTSEYFVRQQYLDFLGREPDQGGLEYWNHEIARCGTDTACVNQRRMDVSASFFMAQEFQETGSFVYGLYKASFGNQPSYKQFIADRAKVVGGTDLDARKNALAAEWVQRESFHQAYPDSLSNEDFVDKLFESAGLIPHTGEWETYVLRLNSGDTRAQVLRMLTENSVFTAKEYNATFVLIEYFAYLRRDPDAGGYAFWLDVLNNREPGNYRGMVCSFITSTEYQKRFSSVVTHSNAECGR